MEELVPLRTRRPASEQRYYELHDPQTTVSSSSFRVVAIIIPSTHRDRSQAGQSKNHGMIRFFS